MEEAIERRGCCRCEGDEVMGALTLHFCEIMKKLAASFFHALLYDEKGIGLLRPMWFQRLGMYARQYHLTFKILRTSQIL